MAAERDEAKGTLVRWSKKCRGIQNWASEVRSKSALYMWFISPLGHVLAFSGIYALTYLAGVFRPRLLYGTAFASSTEGKKGALFLDYRIFFLTTLAIFEVMLGTKAESEIEVSIETPLLAFLAQQAIYAVGLFLFLCWSASFIWIASGVARAPLRLNQSIMVAGYGASLVWLTVPLLFGVFIFPVLSINAWLFDPVNGGAPDLAAFGIVGLLTMIWAVQVTFVKPVTALHPNVSKGKLWFGWFVGVFLTGIGISGVALVWVALTTGLG